MSEESDNRTDAGTKPLVDNEGAERGVDLPQAVAITETGSSVIIDMVQLGGQSPPDTPVQASPMMSNPNFDRITFSDLEAFVPKREQQPVIEAPKAPMATPAPAPKDEVVDVKPPSLTKFFFIVLVLLLAGATGFAGWRLDWDWRLMQKDPELAMQIVAGLRVKPAPPVSRPAAAPPAEQMRGRLSVTDLVIVPIAQGKTEGLRVDGIVKNGTNRVQRAITLKVSLLTVDGLKTASQRVRCCAELASVADGHPTSTRLENDELPPPDTVLQPGQTTKFSAFFPRKSVNKDPLKASAEVAFSEAERVKK